MCRSICFQVGSPFVSKETNQKSVTAPPDNTNKTHGSAGLICHYCFEHHHHRRRHCTFETLGFLTVWYVILIALMCSCFFLFVVQDATQKTTRALSFQSMLKEFTINFVGFNSLYKLRIKVSGLSLRKNW